jgi:tRNA1(Val) A37 N6-methylase TrmN6
VSDVIDTLLGGRVHHRQRAHGHRSGIEPVLLAAAVPARSGQRVLEAGTGSGAALLCLATRVPGLSGLGVEQDGELVALAEENIARNEFNNLRLHHGDLAEFTADAVFDHAFANPPWYAPRATPSPDAARAVARQAQDGLFTLWADRLARCLRHRGTLTFIVHAGVVSDCLAGFSAAGCGSHTIFPLWPRAGRPAKLVLLQAVRGGRGPTRILPGLVLHDDHAPYTEAAACVLRGGHALPFGDFE